VRPQHPPALRERLTIISLSALQWGLGVAALGLLIGTFTDKPGAWTAAGAGVGALIGGIKGHGAIRSGWRLRGGRDENGVESLPSYITLVILHVCWFQTWPVYTQAARRRGR